MSLDLFDKTVLITGGTGSFGQRFAKTILERNNINKLIIYSRDELKQWQMQQDPDFAKHLSKMRFFLGDVRDYDRLEMALREVDFVVHAAALKQIPATEYDPMECIKTNVHGAENIVRAAIRMGVNTIMALSTDKAANPVNLYGASKLASDKIFIAAQHLAGRGGPKFGVVRYGNVVGSRGSIIPFFRSIIDNGGNALPITDDRMTRFMITLDQGVDFVLTAAGMMKIGGELFVPKIPSLRMIDLAKFMAPKLPIKIVGIRPGEKLHEIMITEDDARSTVEVDDRYIIKSAFWHPDHVVPNSSPVEDRFTYASDNNEDWLDEDRFNTMIKDV
jgi:UDP-N-acetylglucosamine 4,6-dehydratase/5-epimerase